MTTEDLTASGAHTWTAPTGVTSVIVRVWGAGGGTAGGAVVNPTPGGGGGAYSTKTITVVPTTVYNYSIGAGGTGGATGVAGGTGGDTWFNTATDTMAKGGGGGAPGAVGAAGNGGAAASGFGTTKFSGGNGSAVAAGNGGGGGGSAGNSSDGGNASGPTGGTAGTGTPPGVAGATFSTGPVAGTQPGGGACGCTGAASSGAAGGDGKVQLQYNANYTATQTDALGLVDSSSQVTTSARSATDPVGLVDSVVADLTVNGTVFVGPDPIGLTDSTVVDFTLGVRVVGPDPVGLTDSISTAAITAVTLTDGLGVTDLATSFKRSLVGTKLNDDLDVRIGATQVTDVYVGTNLVWHWLVSTPYVFNFTTPGLWSMVVPAGCTSLSFDMGGAHGGAGNTILTSTGGAGGAGGTVQGTFAVTPGQLLTGYVGERGNPGTSFGTGGAPGGRGCAENILSHEHEAMGGTGGGYSSIRLTGVLMAVAGAGGGGGAGGNGAGNNGGVGGAGGGTTGANGADGSPSGGFGINGKGGLGGTSSAGGIGGATGYGGNAPDNTTAWGSPGLFLTGGLVWRLQPFGGATVSALGGGGAGGYFGGGPGGSGGVSLGQGGAGGGGGGSSYTKPTDVTGVTHHQGANAGTDGYVTLSLISKRIAPAHYPTSDLFPSVGGLYPA